MKPPLPQIAFCPGLKDLVGLGSLGSVAGDLVLTNTDLLTVNGLDNLQVVGGNLVVQNNRQLRHLLGLRNLVKVGGNITIQRNPMIRLVPQNVLGALEQQQRQAGPVAG